MHSCVRWTQSLKDSKWIQSDKSVAICGADPLQLINDSPALMNIILILCVLTPLRPLASTLSKSVRPSSSFRLPEEDKQHCCSILRCTSPKAADISEWLERLRSPDGAAELYHVSLTGMRKCWMRQDANHILCFKSICACLGDSSCLQWVCMTLKCVHKTQGARAKTMKPNKNAQQAVFHYNWLCYSKTVFFH